MICFRWLEKFFQPCPAPYEYWITRAKEESATQFVYWIPLYVERKRFLSCFFLLVLLPQAEDKVPELSDIQQEGDSSRQEVPSSAPFRLSNLFSTTGFEGATSTPTATSSQEAGHQVSWAKVIQPVETCDPLDILKEEQKRKVETQKDILASYTMDFQAQARLLPRYDPATGQLVITTLKPLAQKTSK